MAGCVEDEEAAGAFEGWVAGGAVVRGSRSEPCGEEGFDGERRGRSVGWGYGVALRLVVVVSANTFPIYSQHGRHTKVVKAVFPPPLGPTSRNVGRLVVAAAFLYKKLCRRIGKTSAMRNVRMIVVGFGASAAVSQLSSSCHAIAPALLLSLVTKKEKGGQTKEEIPPVCESLRKRGRIGQGERWQAWTAARGNCSDVYVFLGANGCRGRDAMARAVRVMADSGDDVTFALAAVEVSVLRSKFAWTRGSPAGNTGEP